MPSSQLTSSYFSEGFKQPTSGGWHHEEWGFSLKHGWLEIHWLVSVDLTQTFSDCDRLVDIFWDRLPTMEKYGKIWKNMNEIWMGILMGYLKYHMVDHIREIGHFTSWSTLLSCQMSLGRWESPWEWLVVDYANHQKMDSDFLRSHPFDPLIRLTQAQQPRLSRGFMET